jgi:hypothetical protein
MHWREYFSEIVPLAAPQALQFAVCDARVMLLAPPEAQRGEHSSHRSPPLTLFGVLAYLRTARQHCQKFSKSQCPSFFAA